MFSAPSNTLVKDYEFVAECDPALDKSDPEFENKYRVYLDGQAPWQSLPLKVGQQPTLWTMRHPSGRVCEMLMGLLKDCQTNDHRILEALYVAAQYGVRSVKNFDNGQGGDIKLVLVKCPETKAPKLSEESMAILRAADQALVYDLGDRVVRSLAPTPLS